MHPFIWHPGYSHLLLMVNDAAMDTCVHVSESLLSVPWAHTLQWNFRPTGELRNSPPQKLTILLSHQPHRYQSSRFSTSSPKLSFLFLNKAHPLSGQEVGLPIHNSRSLLSLHFPGDELQGHRCGCAPSWPCVRKALGPFPPSIS